MMLPIILGIVVFVIVAILAIISQEVWQGLLSALAIGVFTAVFTVIIGGMFTMNLDNGRAEVEQIASAPNGEYMAPNGDYYILNDDSVSKQSTDDYLRGTNVFYLEGLETPYAVSYYADMSPLIMINDNYSRKWYLDIYLPADEAPADSPTVDTFVQREDVPVPEEFEEFAG